MRLFLGITVLFSTLAAKANGLPSLPTSPDHQYTLVISTYGVDDKELQQLIVNTFVEGVTKIGTQAIVATDMKDLQISFKGLSDGMLSTLGQINSRLPENKEAYFNLYYLPLLKNGLINKSKTIRSVPLETPAGVISAKLVHLSAGTNMTDSEFELYTDLSNSIVSHNQYWHEKGFAKDQKPFYFSTVAIETRLQKNQSGFQIQGLIGFPKGKMEFKEAAPEVQISHLVVDGHRMIDNNDSLSNAETPSYQSTAPVALVNVNVHQNQKEEIRMGLTFGAFGGVSDVNNFQDSLTIADLGDNARDGKDWLTQCENRAKSTIYFDGLLQEKALDIPGLKSVIKNRQIGFHFYHLDFVFDEKGQPSVPEGGIDIRVSTLGLTCLPIGRVNTEFKDKINVTVQEEIKKFVRIDDMSANLLDLVGKPQ
ncbi:MAG: hypothetical protein K2Q26_14625 [Bdellovibrionales bacterium]|nr:hypothetical protein [Bdellovibrionales bacterium]